MTIIRLEAKAGPDGALRLTVPVGAADGEFEVAVGVTTPKAGARPKTPEELGWPPGWFEKTYGSITDEKFVARRAAIEHPVGRTRQKNATSATSFQVVSTSRR